MNIVLAQQIFNLIVVPLLGIFVGFLIKYINAQKDRLIETTNNELIQKYVGVLNDIIITCVVATNQTYVEALKEKNMFDEEAQKNAFKLTFDKVKKILSKEAQEVLSMVYEDLDTYITEQIESMVHMNKMNIPFNNDNNWNEEWNNTEPPIDYTYTE